MLIWKVGDKGTRSAIELIPQGVHENKKEYLAEQGVKRKHLHFFITSTC